jgi:hypothetical protein
MSSEISLDTPLFYSQPMIFLSSSPMADRLNHDKELMSDLRKIIVKSYNLLRFISISNAFFSLEPEGNKSIIIAQTLPQETWGGFGLRLGLKEFLMCVKRAEEILQ